MNCQIRNAKEDDAPVLCNIYNHYVEHTIVTFDLELKKGEAFQKEMQEIMINYPFYVAVAEDLIVGYAYANFWKTRRAYAQCVESSIYLNPNMLYNGIGTLLYAALLDDLNKRGIHSVIGGISLPNNASVRLHEKFGFEKVAHFKEVGYKFSNWIDVGYWELILNRQ